MPPRLRAGPAEVRRNCVTIQEVTNRSKGEPLRVLHVAEPTTGGVPAYVERIATQQVAAGAVVDILTPAGHRLGPGTHHEWRLDRSNVRTYPGALRALDSTLDVTRPDVLHLHSFVAGVAGRLPARRSKGPATVYQPHAWATDRFGGVASRAVRWWEVAASGRTDVLVANCEDEVQQGRSFGITVPAVSIGVPIDVRHFRPPEDRERDEARAAVGHAAKRVVLVVGRIGFQKAQDLLVPEWERQPIPDSDLVLLGDGDPGPLARAAPHEWGRTIFHVPGTPDVRRWLWAADVVAIPSRYETVSLVAAEALSVGRSVVATRFNGAVEAIVAGGDPAGGIVELGDLRGLLQACRDRLDDPAAYADERVNGPARVRRLYTVEAVTARLDAAYRLATAATGRG